MAFSQSTKKGTLEPFKDFPAFFGGLAGCRQRGIPAALFWGRFSCRAWVYGVQLLVGFLLLSLRC